MSSFRIVALISGEGTNLQYLINLINSGVVNAKLVSVISNNASANGLNRANANNIPTHVLEWDSTTESREEYNVRLADLVSQYKYDVIYCLGWLFVLNGEFLSRHPRIINLHPALPGELPGQNVAEKAYNAYKSGKITRTGVMVHEVIEKIDAGNCLSSRMLVFNDNETLEEFKNRMSFVEKEVVLEGLQRFMSNTEYDMEQYNLSVSDINNVIQYGKVRDYWDIGYNYMVFSHSDRQSAFDRHLCNIPGKGALLNQINNWWMNQTRHIIDNHYVWSNEHVLVAKKCRKIPLEIVVRGYITGNTSTSLWTHYSNGSREYCGLKFPDGLVRDQQLPEPVITPTTKGEIDEPISGEEILRRNVVLPGEWEYIQRKALELYRYGQMVARSADLILVDTKYEFGYDSNGKIVLIDELHTCDSSRYWRLSTYQERFSNGLSPQKLDKDAVRDYIKSLCDPYKVEKIPEIPEEKIRSVYATYQELYLRLTGRYNADNVDISLPVDYSEVVREKDISLIKQFYRDYVPTVVILAGSERDDKHVNNIKSSLEKLNVYAVNYVASAHKHTRRVLRILEYYNSQRSIGRKVIWVTCAGRSNALSGVIAANTEYPVFACPPFADKTDMIVNINSTLQMPSQVPVMTVLDVNNLVICINRLMREYSN